MCIRDRTHSDAAFTGLTERSLDDISEVALFVVCAIAITLPYHVHTPYHHTSPCHYHPPPTACHHLEKSAPKFVSGGVVCLNSALEFQANWFDENGTAVLTGFRLKFLKSCNLIFCATVYGSFSMLRTTAVHRTAVVSNQTAATAVRPPLSRYRRPWKAKKARTLKRPPSPHRRIHGHHRMNSPEPRENQDALSVAAGSERKRFELGLGTAAVYYHTASITGSPSDASHWALNKKHFQSVNPLILFDIFKSNYRCS